MTREPQFVSSVLRQLCAIFAVTALASNCRSIDRSEVKEFPVEHHSFASDLSYSTVRVFFATNRRVDETKLYQHATNYINPAKAEALAQVFSGHRHFPYVGREDPTTDQNHYGMIQVSIPDHHRRGQPKTCEPEDFDVRNHVGLINIWLYENGDEFVSKAKAAAAAATSKDILVMIHGFNVTFAKAAEAYGTFVYDVEFKGVPILYTWASDGVVSAYADDEDTIRLSQVNFNAFMKKVLALRDQLGGKIHLLAHSMGNRLLVDYLYDQRERHRGELFENVVFAAPDVDGTEFNMKLVQARGLARRFTLYANDNDLALLSSNLSHNWRRRWLEWLGLSEVGSSQRAGSAGDKKILVEKIDTMDLTPLHTGGLHHSDFATNPVVIQDVAAVLNASMGVDERLKRFNALSLRHEPYKAEERRAAGLPVTFYQFKEETPLAVLSTTPPKFLGQIVRLNASNKVYLKLFSNDKGFEGDFPFARSKRDRYVGNWGKDVELLLVPSLCQVHVIHRRGDFDHVMQGRRASPPCVDLERLADE